MTRRRLVSAGVVGAATVTLGVASLAPASAITTPKTFRVVAPDTERAMLDEGRPGPSLGDRRVFAGPIHRPGSARVVGRFDGVCTVTSNPAGPQELRQLCVATATFDDQGGAEVSMQGVGRRLAEDVILSVTGGNRRYQNVRGQATLDFRTPGRTVIDIALIP